MYEKYNDYMKQGVKDEAYYIRYALEHIGEEYLTEETGRLTTSRITLTKADGTVLYDSEKNPDEMENHNDRPEFQSALSNWNRGSSEIFGNPLQADVLLCRKVGKWEYSAGGKDNGQCISYYAFQFYAFRKPASGDTCSGICGCGEADGKADRTD